MLVVSAFGWMKIPHIFSALCCHELNLYLSYILLINGDASCFLQSDRLNRVLEYVNEVHSICGVLGLDFGQTVSDVHPSLHGTAMGHSTNISNSTLEGLEHAIVKLKAERKIRIQKVMEIFLYYFICFYLSYLG